MLRQIEVAAASGKATPQASREAGIAKQLSYRSRKEYVGVKLEQAKRLVAELSLERQVLQGAARRNLCGLVD